MVKNAFNQQSPKVRRMTIHHVYTLRSSQVFAYIWNIESSPKAVHNKKIQPARASVLVREASGSITVKSGA
jgi:hypothetical protein